jgi:hypothetical protein
VLRGGPNNNEIKTEAEVNELMDAVSEKYKKIKATE